MISERLARAGREIFGIEGAYWANNARRHYKNAVAAEQAEISLLEESFVPWAVAWDIAAPTTSSLARRVVDGIIDDGPKPLAALITGLALDATGYSALYALYMQLPKDSELAFTAGTLIAGGLALRVATLSTINVIEARIEAAKAQIRK